MRHVDVPACDFIPDAAFSFQGLTLLVGSNNTGLVEAIERELGFLSTPNRRPDNPVGFFFHDATLPPREDFHAPPLPPQDQVRFSESMTGHFPPGAPRAWVIADSGFRWDEAVLASINILSHLSTLALGRSRGTLTFHAAALVRNEAALLLPGMTGSGKSTLSFVATLAGWTCLTDEWTILLPGPPFEIMGFPRGFRIYGEIVKTYPELFPEEQRACKYAAFEDSGFLILPEISDRTPFDRSYPIERIILLNNLDGQTAPELESIGSSEATYELLASLFGASRKEEGEGAREFNRQGFVITRKLIDQIPIHRLTYDIFRHLPKIPGLLNSLV